MFVFGTNVPKMRYYNEFMRESVIKINPHTYNVIRLNLVQKQFLDKLFSTKAAFPENAESTLESMVPRIEKSSKFTLNISVRPLSLRIKTAIR